MTVSDGQPAGVPLPGPPAARPGPPPSAGVALSPTPGPAGAHARGPAPATAPGPSPAAARSAAPITERVAAAAQSVEAIDSRPLAEHADLYQQVHSELQSALAEIDGA